MADNFQNQKGLVATSRNQEIKQIELFDSSIITPEYYLSNYLELIGYYISKGRPSKDTLTTYNVAINQFLLWARYKNIIPLKATEYQLRIYLQFLYDRGYKDESIAIKIIAIRAFYSVALKLGLCTSNPCIDIKTSSSMSEDEQFYYFSVDQIKEIISVFKDEEDVFIKYRNMAMIMLMAVEGLRNVEIHRMNIEDIDTTTKSILVRGKGRNRRIYPCEDTFYILQEFLKVSPPPLDESFLRPVFLSDSNFSEYKRLSRNGIRYIMNKALEKSGYKMAGISCHVFRHSCGTNLYAQEKDLRLVQEVLGHKDPKTTARYAHVHEKVSKRLTAKISPLEDRGDA